MLHFEVEICLSNLINLNVYYFLAVSNVRCNMTLFRACVLLGEVLALYRVEVPDHVVHSASFLADRLLDCNLTHSRSVAYCICWTSSGVTQLMHSFCDICASIHVTRNSLVSLSSSIENAVAECSKGPLTILLICSTQLHVQVALWGYCYVMDGGNCQPIESTFSDSIVHSWMWWTVTGSFPLGYISSIAASS